ncbi:PilN domain-containing protein [Candidatus Pantoea floridensis]|uniref:Pilus assembly protein HofN n=1 Tax=Candidatus Pantoea floridensis TaxID=1938870 RepID=A0A286BUG0_9GAMM|nr:PilN domain-containing protein [Pantoea floridensis]PIF13684.1 pilus assembly protein HofN [Enterobacteriaceae bacterium JKS000233]SOD37783.1 pilus assembly protein HofN [Pantoea floridensis]
MMLAVNLLPWRLHQQQRQRKQSITLLTLTLMLTLFMLLMLWWRGFATRQQQLEQLMDITFILNALQQQLEKQQSLLQQRESLLQTQRAEQQRQVQHRRWQGFWQQLPELMPETLWLNRLERRQGQLILEGQAQSMAAVSDFRHQLMTQPLFSSVRQGGVQRQVSGDYRFALHARVQELADE